MKKQFQSKSVPRGTRTIWRYLGALFILFTFAVGNVMADTELCSASISDITATANTTGVAQTGCTMKWNAVTTTASDIVTISGVNYRKFTGSGSYVQLILTSGNFQEGDVLTVILAGKDSSKKTVEFSLKADDGNSASGSASKTVTDAVAYTLKAGDIETDGSIKIFRHGSSNSRYGSFSVVRPADCTETAPTSVAVSGGATYDKGDALSNLSAAVTGGTGTMSYQWYRNTTNAATISDDLKLANCTTATLAPTNKVGTYYYYCVASNCAGSVTSGTTAVTINADCSATGDIFTMTMNSSNAPSSEVKTPASSTMSIDTYINIDGGDIVLVTGSSQHSSITTSPKIKLGGSSGYAKITLDCPLQEGDKITFVKTNKIALAADASGTNKIQLASGTNEYIITKEDCLYNQSNLFILRDGNNVEISSITITRPVMRTISFDSNGGSAVTAIQVEDGTAATKPSDPTWAHHRFDGWYNGSDPYDWSETVGGDLTLTAHWTQLYTITFANGGGTGDAPAAVADKAKGETFPVPANTFTAPDGKVFEKWNDGATDYNPEDTYTVGTSNVILTAVWRTPSTMYGITKGAHENGDFTVDPASQEAGEIVTLVATPNENYLFDSWEIVKTEDASATGITVDANGQFTMPGYAVTVNATFVADTRKKVLYVTTNAEDATKANDKLYAALKDIYNVSIVGYASEADQTNYDLVVLHESIGGGNYGAAAVAAAKTGNTPVLNTKSYFYNDGRWGWGAPNAGQSVKGATLNSAYCNIANHPLFDGVTMTDGFFEITDDAAAKCMQPVGEFTTGKEGYTLATTPNSGEGNGCAIHELTPAQRGASAGKYLMISVSNAKLNALNANGQKLFQNAAAYLIDGSVSWTPIAVPTTPEITGTTAYKTGENIALTASATGTIEAATYAWYKGATWAEAETAGVIKAAATTAAGGNAYAKAGCAVGDAGKYWCVISNGTDCDVKVSVDVTVAQTFTVSYLPGDGTGATIVDGNATVVADCPSSFIAPTTGKMFYGWKDDDGNDVAVGAAVTSSLVLYAQWGDIMVAKIGDTMYPSLEAALLHAADGTIELLQDIDVTAQVEILAGVTATIDLAGHKIEYTGSTTLTSGVILVHNGASLTINDSSDPDAGSIVSGDKAYAAVALTKLGDDPSTPATLVVNGGALTGYYYGITGNGSRNNTVITINGGTITGTVGIAIYHPQVGTLTVNNGSLTGVDAAIEMRAGTLVINDGTFTATATEFSCNPNGSGSTTTGAAIAIAQHTTKKDISVTINGGTFNGVKALNESNPQVNDPAPQVTMAVKDGNFVGEVSTVDVNHFISGGTFKFEVLNDQCAPNFVPSPADPVTGKYTVEPKDAVSLIKAVATATSQDITGENLTGIYKGAAHISASGSYKFNQGNYFMVQLKDGENFQAGDIVKINVASVNDCNGFALYSADEFTSANLIIDTHENSDAKAKVSTGINEVELPNTYAGSNKLYVARCGDCDKYLNAGINKVEVTRIVYPELKAITIDGRDGVINEAAKTVAVTIPYEADLAALTVVPTIVWNEAAAENSIVVNNGAAWTLGANTYKLTDKDGDYTVYTITLTRDILKHTVSFNTHGGSAVANVLVEHNAYLTAVPNDPSKEDYIFQYWSLTDGGDEVDITTVQIDEDKEFHAVWASEGAIKLFDGEGNLNTTNFISPAKTTIEIADVEHVCLAEFSSNRSSLGGATPTDMVKYDVTTDKAKIQMTFYNNNSGTKKAILYKYEEGGTPEKIEIEVPGQQIFTTEYYEFNSSKNRSFYVCMNDRSNIRVLQVKVVDNGANPVKQFGQVGYSLNLNKARFYAKAAVEKSFEGFTFTPSSEYKVYNNSNLATTSANSFTIASPTVMSVKRSGGKYYVYQDPADKGTLYSADAEIELNATGTWYISSETTSSAASFTKIEFLAPKCEKPTITTQPATKQTFDPGNLTATVVATVSDGGTLKYQWYNASNDEEVEGATEATLTTTTAGTYYVIVTNTLADHRDNSVKSEEATLGYRVTTDATLSALSASAGTLDPAFAKDVLEYRVDLPEGTTVVPTLSATATMDGYATVAINNATAFVNYEATSTVVVTSEDATANKTYTVKFYVDHLLPQVDVTESTTWNWTYAAEGTVTIKVTDSTEPIKKNEEGLMANVRVDDNKPTNDATFNSQALLFYGENVRAKDGGRWYASLGHIKFNVTKPGIVEVEFSDNGSNNRCLSINGFMSPKSSSKTDIKTFKVFVPAGEVTLMGMEGAETDKYIRISKITYTVKESPDYWRNVSSNYGTLCVEHNVLVGGAMGATFYQIASRNEDYDYKIDFEEVLPNEELKAGEPYLFKSNTGKIELFFSETTSNVAPIEVRGMIGNYAATTLAIDESNMSTTYYFANNKLWSCENLVGVGLTLNEHRAYIDFTDVPTYADYEASKQQQQNSAPRRRVSLEMNGEKIATGCENLNVSDKPVKMIINGQLFILRGEKMYDAKGQLVK